MDKPEKKDLSDVLSAIRDMVHKETRAKFTEGISTDAAKVSAETPAAKPTNLPSKILILRPHMRVYPSKRKTVILDKNMRVPHDAPIEASDSFAIANPSIDEGMLRDMLRDMVREVVQEQLRGELGQEIVGAIKRDMALLLEKNG